jgi:glycerol-3-phosphate dehydrogenase
MRVRDELSGEEMEVRARMTINAAGAHAGDVMRMFGVSREFPLLKAMNLVTSKPAGDMALAAPAFPGASGGTRYAGAMLTMTPWHARAMVGTFQSETFAQPSELPVSDADIDEMIAAANSAFPALKLAREDVTLVHRGIVPARKGRDGRAALLAAPQIIDHDTEGARGAMTVIGVKYTTARLVGARTVEAAIRRLGTRSLRTRRPQIEILPGAGIADHEALAIETARAVGLELAPPIIRHLTDVYGDRCVAIIRLMAERSDWRMPLVSGRPNIGAEIIHAIRHEMAATLSDIVIRRTELGAAGYPGDEVVAACARIAAEEFEWDGARRSAELEQVIDFYRGRK